ncbi:MAG: SulP family inorganic anion transporter [Saprospiraceae bacterium]|nr:SulP family inorganic anion transporter [Candidatus Vicinibacter affinis]
MRKKIKYYRLIWLKHDLPAGLAVFFVALPLCLGIALASGAPLYSGLMAGIIGGIVVSLISGSQLGVSGPAAGLTTVVAASIVSLGDFSMFLLAVIVAGMFQLILGLLKLGSIAHYFPSSVIKGMLAAIGIILISKQIPIALGYDEPDFWNSGFLGLFSEHKFLLNFISFNKSLTTGTIIITILSLGLLIFFKVNMDINLKFFLHHWQWLCWELFLIKYFIRPPLPTT